MVYYNGGIMARNTNVLSQRRATGVMAQAKFDGTRYQLAHNLENGGVPVQPSLSNGGGERYTYLRSGDINKC